MFDRWIKHWRATWRGLATPVEAQGFASKLAIDIVREHRNNPQAPPFVHMVAHDPEYLSVWSKQYFAQLEAALDHATLVDQAFGLRRITLDYLDHVAEGTWTRYEAKDPWKPRSSEAAADIGKTFYPDLSVDEFLEYESAQTAGADFSSRITRVMSEEFFKDDPQKYADAYEAMTGMFWRLRCEGIVCAAAGIEFLEQRHLNFLEAAVGTHRDRICTGHSLVIDESFRDVVLRQREQTAN